MKIQESIATATVSRSTIHIPKVLVDEHKIEAEDKIVFVTPATAQKLAKEMARERPGAEPKILVAVICNSEMEPKW